MQNSFDIIIIGGGPAGVSAALTCRNRGKSVGVIANTSETTALYKAELISNYPGLENKTGAEIESVMRTQLENSGALLISGRALSVMPLGDVFGIAVGNDFYTSSAVILAVGITRETLYSGEAEYLGRGVSYCATCDGMLYRGKTVAVIGGGREAKEDADFLQSIGCNVLRFEKNLRYAIKGGERVEKLIAGTAEYGVQAVFIIKDSISVTNLVPGLERGANGIQAARGMETNIAGIFAAGDCAGKPYQLAKAVGEGNIAALSACEYIERNKKEKNKNGDSTH